MDIVSWTFQNEFVDQDKPLYIDCNDPTRSVSFRETRTLVRKLVSGFNDHGLVKGDCVCVVSFNEIHYTSLFLGIIGAGGCFSGANPGYTAHELTHHVRITKARFLLTSPKTLDITVMAAEKCGIPLSNVFVLDFQDEVVPNGHQSWRRLLSCGESNWVTVEDPDTKPAAYVSTSGTSGLPKAAIIPHSYLVSQGQYQDRTAKTRYKLSNLIAIPPFHVFTIPVQHALPLRQGTPTYIMPRFEVQGFVNALQKFKITHTAVVPPILMALSQCGQDEKLQSLRRIYVGGSCATDGMQQQLYSQLSPKARIEQVYGMTEAGWATNWHDREQECTGSVGRPLPGTKLRLVDRHGDVIREDDTNGELHIKSPHPMLGYLSNPAATAEAFSEDGWVRTGDVGYVRNGRWYVIDRTKDLIKVRGWQVSPAEIEGSLLEHPDISDAAVIGVPARDNSGEVPLAFVVRKDGSHLSENDIKSFLGERLARYKGVDEVKFIDNIPRNPTGKILRRVLRDSRTSQPLSPNQIAASAYSNAIRDLEKSQRERKAGQCAVHSRTNSLAESIQSIPVKTHSRTPSLAESIQSIQPKTHTRTPSLDESIGRLTSRTHSRTASLTSASTISDTGPATPPTMDEMMAMSNASTSLATTSNASTTKTTRKRRGELISPCTVKRRSGRIGAVRVRTTTS